MTHPDLFAESYPSFWNAIPVDLATPARIHAPVLVDQPDPPVATDSTRTREEPIPVTLFVEETDVG